MELISLLIHFRGFALSISLRKLKSRHRGG